MDLKVPACTNGYHAEHTVRVRIGGRGIPLVVAHGYTGESRNYELLLAEAARNFQVIAVDLAGHGGTPNFARTGWSAPAYADLLVCTLEMLGIEKAVLVGHSFGGRVVAEAACLKPSLALALVPINAILGEHWDRLVGEIRRRPYKVLPLGGRLARDMATMAWKVRTTDQSTALIRLSFDTYLRNFGSPWRMFPAVWAIFTAQPSAEVLREVRKNGTCTIVVQGVEDPLLSLEDAESIRDLTDGQLIRVESPGSSGHCWLLARREALPELLQAELLYGNLGGILRRAVESSGLDPDKAASTDVQKRFCRPDALALRLNPLPAPWTGRSRFRARLRTRAA